MRYSNDEFGRRKVSSVSYLKSYITELYLKSCCNISAIKQMYTGKVVWCGTRLMFDSQQGHIEFRDGANYALNNKDKMLWLERWKSHHVWWSVIQYIWLNKEPQKQVLKFWGNFNFPRWLRVRPDPERSSSGCWTTIFLVANSRNIRQNLFQVQDITLKCGSVKFLLPH